MGDTKHNEEKKKTTYIIFWMLVFIGILILFQFFIPIVKELVKGKVFLIPIAVFCLLGISLIIFTIKKIKGKIKSFLLLTGLSAVVFFVFGVLHNLFYALSIVTKKIIFLHYIMEALHTCFFLISVLVCPVGFLIGTVGSIILLLKNKRVRKF